MIGTQIGPLVISKLLGEGGMGRVYEAVHAVLKTKRAIKVLLPELTQNPMIVKRFVNEARAAASLQHRSLLQVHDVGQLPDGSWFMVLDYLEGGTLGRFMASQGGPMAPHLIVQIVAGIANGLQVAHANNIIHRDLEPENIFLVSRERDPHHPVIIDWGVAQLSEDLNPGTGTRTGVVIGTPAYMAPEQLRGGKVGPAADVYSLATIAYAMYTGGYFPHQLEETRGEYFHLAPTEIYHRQMTSPPRDPRRRFAGIGDATADAILAAIATDPTRRTQTPRALILALADATPTNGMDPDGLEVVRTVARELFDTDAMLDTIRSSSTPQATPAPPSKPESRYQLGRKLGAGGMAEVFAAQALGEHGFTRQVAVKRILPGMSEVPAFASMFVSEAQIASRLSHPNIVSVLDFARDAEGRLFLAMELVEGKDLAAVLESGPLPPSIAIYITIELLRALGYAHALPISSEPASGARGIIHRDISPQNLMLSYEGAVKVLDFGLAKLKEASGAVRSDHVRGKPSYMSPEQINGEPLDTRSDLFAVGVMLWEVLSHRPLFRGSHKEIAGQLLFRPIPTAGSVRSRVPPDLDAVALRLLARERDQRYATAEEAISDLLRCEAAPRDGRGELVRLLAERFPESTASERGAGHAAPARGLQAAQIAVPEPPSTLAGAASQSIAGGGSAKGRRGLIAAIAGMTILGTGIGVVLALKNTGSSTEIPARPISSDAAALAFAPDAALREQIAPASLPVDASAISPPDAVEIATVKPDAAEPMLDAATTAATPGVRVDAGPRGRTPLEKGDFVVRVTPWADVRVDGKLVGTTPIDMKLPVGKHRIVLESDKKKKAITVIVTTSKPTIIEETW